MSDDSFFYAHAEKRDTKSSIQDMFRKESNPDIEKSRGSIHSDNSKKSSCSNNDMLLNSLNKWIPDEYSKRCMKCKRHFDFFTRKHHCRKCGYLLCFSCCSQWVKIKDLVNSTVSSKLNKKSFGEIKKIKHFSKMKTLVRV